MRSGRAHRRGDRGGSPSDKAKSPAHEEELLLAAKKKVDDELYKRVKEATDAAPHFQGHATATAGLSGADKATWEALPDDDDALAEELSAIAATLSRSVADKDARRAFSDNARKIGALAEATDDARSTTTRRWHRRRFLASGSISTLLLRLLLAPTLAMRLVRRPGVRDALVAAKPRHVALGARLELVLRGAAQAAHGRHLA